MKKILFYGIKYGVKIFSGGWDIFEQNLLSLLGKCHFFPVIAYVDQFIGNQGVCPVQKSGACGNAVSERVIDIFQSPFN